METEGLDVGCRSNAVAHAGDLHRPPGNPLVQRQQVKRNERDPSGNIKHPVIKLGEREAAVDGTGGDSLFAAHRVAGQQGLHAPTHAHQPGLPLQVGRRHKADRRIADLGVVAHVDQVAGRSEL